ncbi:MAG: hypothetical protein IKV35_07280 [Clostridia bacterium]|nr:hypothetical protein [Clostridia bacterium]
MKKTAKRILAMLLCGALMSGGLTACKKGDKTVAPPVIPVNPVTDRVLDNGNIDTTPAEEGTEAELTAVRSSLVKSSETEGLGTVTKLEWYENGVRMKGENFVKPKDNKKVYWAGDVKRVVNYPDGYILDIPSDWDVDFSLATVYSRYGTDDVLLSVTNEDLSPYMGAKNNVTDPTEKKFAAGKAYIDTMFRCINNENYMTKNNIAKLSEETRDVDGARFYVLKMRVNDVEDGTKGVYTYAVYYTETRLVQMMFKCVDDRDFASVYNTIRTIGEAGAAVDYITYPCIDNESWTPETKALYDSIVNKDTVTWGLAYGNIEDDCVARKYPKLEKPLEHTFEMVSTYSDTFLRGFQTNGANRATSKGRFLQFTPHFSENWGEQMGDKALIMDMYRGDLDEEIRAMAQDIVAYGKPMLLRVSNEMNSDWTPWGAINTMLDPDIFTEVWIRMYNIFKEEGANQYCIWVWNPQSEHSFPDTRWNDIRLYMPGSNYVDMIGLTAYNFGTAYQWDTFEDLYDPIQEVFGKHFGDWGWIISEFGCSDSDAANQPDRKAQWIREMFASLPKYPNIKAAVWFNGNDYNPDGTMLHEIALDGDPASIQAFKEGLAASK